MHVSEIINTKENSSVCKFVSVYLCMSKDVSYYGLGGGGGGDMNNEQHAYGAVKFLCSVSS